MQLLFAYCFLHGEKKKHNNKDVCILQNKAQTLEWKHVRKLYEVTAQSASNSLGLRMAHKLSREYIYLTPHSCMRVDLAAQVRLHYLNNLYIVHF